MPFWPPSFPPLNPPSPAPQETSTTILTLNKVGKVVPGGKEILSNISLGIYLGAKIGVLGANGAGKSTLMRLLSGIDTEYRGGALSLSIGPRPPHALMVNA